MTLSTEQIILIGNKVGTESPKNLEAIKNGWVEAEGVFELSYGTVFKMNTFGIIPDMNISSILNFKMIGHGE